MKACTHGAARRKAPVGRMSCREDELQARMAGKRHNFSVNQLNHRMLLRSSRACFGGSLPCSSGQCWPN